MASVFKVSKAIVGDLAKTMSRQRDFHRAQPRAALLFLTYRCTSRCNTCTMWKRPKSGATEIGLDGWKRIVDLLRDNGVTCVELFGGDVLLRKDILIPLIRYLKQNEFVIHLPTNANLLDQATARGLVDSGVDVIYISIDGVEDVHDDIRGLNGTFEKAKRAVKEINAVRGNRGIPKLICNTTVSKFNVDFLEQIPAFAEEMGFDENHFEYVGEVSQELIDNSVVNGTKATPYFIRQGDSVLVSKDAARILKNKIRLIKRRYRSSRLSIVTINIDSLSLENLQEGTVPTGKCYMERNEVTVDPCGNVIVCPFMHRYILGNMLEENWGSIWNNELHRKFREHQNSNRIAMCRHCIMSVQRNPSFFASMKRIYLFRIQSNCKRLFGPN